MSRLPHSNVHEFRIRDQTTKIDTRCIADRSIDKAEQLGHAHQLSLTGLMCSSLQIDIVDHQHEGSVSDSFSEYGLASSKQW